MANGVHISVGGVAWKNNGPYVGQSRLRSWERVLHRLEPSSVRAGHDPHETWRAGLENVRVGEIVEMQFRFKPTNSFGWWRGQVKEVRAPSE